MEKGSGEFEGDEIRVAGCGGESEGLRVCGFQGFLILRI
jgi:hypothetical protein